MRTTVGFVVLAAVLVAASAGVRAQETQQQAAGYLRWLVQTLNYGTMATQNVCPPLNAYAFASEEDFAESGSKPGQLRFIVPDVSAAYANLMANPLGSFSIARENCSCEVNCGGMPYDVLVCNRATFSGNFTVMDIDMTWPSSDPDLVNFVKAHPAVANYLEGESPHTWYMLQLDLVDIYYTGGYGSIHYIGNIPVDMYYAATPEPSP